MAPLSLRLCVAIDSKRAGRSLVMSYQTHTSRRTLPVMVAAGRL